MEPTGRAKARPMTGSAKSGILAPCTKFPDCAALHPGYVLKLDCFASLAMTLLKTLLRRAPKLLRRRIEHEQRAFGDAEIGAVQLELVAFDEGADEGKRHQVFQ